jgi:archaeosine synthase
VRFEITKRDGLARLGELEIDGHTHATPAIAFVDSWMHSAPSHELKLRQSSLAKEGDLSIASSSFTAKSDEESALLKVGYRGSPFADSAPDGPMASLTSIAELMLDSKAFADAIDALKAGPDLLRPTFCPIAGLPNRLALLAYCGLDVFDSIPLIMSAESGVYLTSTGGAPHDIIGEPPCNCEACNEGIEDKRALLRHNISSAAAELRLVRHHIAQGSLRELVEARVRSESWQVQVLRLLDLEHSRLQEMHAPVRGTAFAANSKESLHRPDVERWRSRLMERYSRPPQANILLLIPCSARKPYSMSPSHRRFREAVRNSGARRSVHEVVVTSPLGLVPRELELFYPAKDYDIPVTGHWDRDECSILTEMVRWLVGSQGYDAVVSHLGSERDAVNPVVDGCIDTSDGSPGSKGSLAKLEDTLEQLVADADAGGDRHSRTRQDMLSILRFQFGEAVCDAFADSTVEGRWPEVRMLKDGVQLGALSYPRGMISLTLDGAEAISRADRYCVEIDDFAPKGNLFAVGVEDATDDVRIGDDVAVRHDGDVRAVGVARMCAAEMRSAQRGEAVHIRHFSR